MAQAQGVVAALAFSVLLVGCGKKQGVEANDMEVVTRNGVRDFRLKDGTRCAAYNGGLTCDWGGPKQ